MTTKSDDLSGERQSSAVRIRAGDRKWKHSVKQ